jgi:hypothetical protein
MQALQLTLTFEGQMVERFEGATKRAAEEDEPLDLSTAAGVRKKYERQSIARYSPAHCSEVLSHFSVFT